MVDRAVTIMRIDKKALVAQLREVIAGEAAAATRAARDAAEAATHEEARPENDKDTRATEASYLARGQAARVRELERSDAALRSLEVRAWSDGEPIGVGALVLGEHASGGPVIYFVAPAGGGMRAVVGGTEVQVVTHASPLGQALLGKTVGDEAEVRAAGGVRLVAIVDVQ